MVERNNAYPTHEGAESLLDELQPGLHEYARAARDTLNPVWQHEMSWVHEWLQPDQEYGRRLSRDGDADELAEEAGEPVAEEVGVRD